MSETVGRNYDPVSEAWIRATRRADDESPDEEAPEEEVEHEEPEGSAAVQDPEVPGTVERDTPEVRPGPEPVAPEPVWHEASEVAREPSEAEGEPAVLDEPSPTIGETPEAEAPAAPLVDTPAADGKPRKDKKAKKNKKAKAKASKAKAKKGKKKKKK